MSFKSIDVYLSPFFLVMRANRDGKGIAQLHQGDRIFTKVVLGSEPDFIFRVTRQKRLSSSSQDQVLALKRLSTPKSPKP